MAEFDVDEIQEDVERILRKCTIEELVAIATQLKADAASYQDSDKK